ncbi:MAG TPA: hypothetical protein VHJ20_24685 [Polyangia bacterium]|nr:hypothetical protein [Polyangia bacterium]
MKRSAAGILAIGAWLAATPARASDPDPWFGRDKALHFSASALIAGAGYGGASVVTDDRRARLLTGAGLALAAGVGKETWDAMGHGDASYRDLTWDVVGTAAGLAVAALIDWSISRLRGAPANAR